ncbi:hypothetical protein [Actinomadura sp. WMMA1423]|uniref:hypothetical protein n=1 Tax=Actinomadura sp. WMMA1423 TaxID=2591108 RepID=UPI00114684E3|nr:hypothetical protein [Actinomadura sp. WMMA1423]
MRDLTGVIGHRPRPFSEFEMGVGAPAFNGDELCTYAVPTAKTVESAVSGIYADLPRRVQNNVLDIVTELIGIAKGSGQPMRGVVQAHVPACTLSLGWFEDGGFHYPLITVFSPDPEMPELPDAAGSLRNWVVRLISRTFRCGAFGHSGRGKTFWAVVDFQETPPTA